MKKRLTVLLCTFALVLAAGLPEGHPRIFAADSDKPALRKKIEDVRWTRDMYERLRREVTPYVERHKSEPGWIIGRLQMNWEEGKRYTRFYADKNLIARREGNAVYPTIRVAAGRVGTGSRTKLEELKAFDNGDMLQHRNGKIVESPFMESGVVAEEINMDIVNLAYRAAIVYYFTGDRDYAKFAADILWVLVRGGAQQEQLNPGSDRDAKGNILSFGFLCYETLGDGRRYTALPLAYDFIYDYLDQAYFDSREFREGRKGEELWAPGHKQGKAWAFEQFETFFRKMVENKISRGGGLLGNWNLNEHYCAMLYAFAMSDNRTRKDGRGREYYIDYLLNKTTPGNGAYRDVVKGNLSPQTGLWPEPPAGYGQGSIQQLVLYGYWYYRQGIDLLNDDPLLKKGVRSFPQIAFPNGRSTAWGDGSYSTIYTLQLELMIAYARDKGDKTLEEEFTALMNYAGKRDFKADFYMPLFFYVPELMKTSRKVESPRVSLSPEHALLMGRNRAEDPANALAYSVNGFAEGSGHYHENGLAMELYGRGQILAADFGAGPNYWHRQHRRFNRMAVAHNTVVVNGAEIGNKDYLPLTVNFADPMPVPGKTPEQGTSADFQFSDVSTQLANRRFSAEFRRVNGIVRLSEKNGFHIDIFRVKMLKGKGEYFDYLYHNMGTELQFTGMNGSPLRGAEQAFDPESGFGYDYLTNARGVSFAGGVKGGIPFGKDGIVMNFFLPGNNRERTFFAMESPPNFRYYDSRLKNTPVPTFMVRRTDDVWARPFVAVYEPAGNGAAPQVVSVRELSNEPGFVALEVKLADGGSAFILNSDNPAKKYRVGEIEFQGIFGVVTPEKLYLGYGTLLKCGSAQVPGGSEIKRK